MSIRKRFIEMIKNGYPEFDQEKDSVEIEFEGGGDSFGSFHYISIWPSREGELDLNQDDNMNILLEVIDAAEVSYNWNDAGTTGNIKYNEEDEQELYQQVGTYYKLLERGCFDRIKCTLDRSI